MDFEIKVDKADGLKIPVSAVTDKNFYLIPLEYMTQGGDSSEDGFYKEVYTENGAPIVFVPTTVYYSDDEFYYVDMGKENGFKAGDYVVRPESVSYTHLDVYKRQIEYYRQTGEKISLHNQQEREKESPYNFLYYVLNTDRALLYERIDRRVDLMVEQGLVEEVKALRDMGCRRGHTSMQGLGYKEILDYLEGRCSLEEAVYIPVSYTHLDVYKRQEEGSFL